MRTLLIALTALLPLETQAASFSCVPLAPPRQQGDERFYTFEVSDAGASLEVAEITGPYRSLHEGLPLDYAHYSDSSSHAGAAWGGRQVALSLVFFGSWWGGNLRVGDEEFDLRCQLAP